MSGDSDHHPAALRNRQPILDELLKLVDPSASGAALEIASGTGAHLEHFAPNFPSLQWQPSEYVEARVQTIGGVERAVDERLQMIDAHGAGANNVRPAVDLDVSLPFTSWPAVVQADASKHALVYCANVCHISPWQCTLGLAGAAAALAPGGGVIVYSSSTAPSSATTAAPATASSTRRCGSATPNSGTATPARSRRRRARSG